MNPSLMMVSAALAATAPLPLGGQSEPPATRSAHEIVALINSASAGALRAYVDSAFGSGMRGLPMNAHFNFFFCVRDQSRRLEWVAVQDEAPLRTTVLLRQKLTGEPMTIRVAVEQAAPNRVAGLGAPPPRPGTAKELRVSSDADMASVLKQYVTTLAAADLFL